MNATQSSVKQLIFLLLLAIGFGWMSFYLIQKQNNRYSFASFIRKDANSTVIINDMDRLFLKDIRASDLKIENEDLIKAFNFLAENKFELNERFGNKALLSSSKESFNVVFQNGHLKTEDIVDFLEGEGIASAVKPGVLTIENKTFHFDYFNEFLLFSNEEIDKNAIDKLPFNPRSSNADYMVIDGDKVSTGLFFGKASYYSQFSDAPVLKGKPVGYKNVFDVIPSDASFIRVIGSTRLREDQKFFGDSTSKNLDWLSNYIVLLKKGDFEVVLSPLSLERDLRLILEEETIENTKDSVGLEQFNLSSYEVTKLKLQNDWTINFPDLSGNPNYFSQLLNFHVLSNSKEAMHWFLSSHQLGNSAANNPQQFNMIRNLLPGKVNNLILVFNDSEGVNVQLGVNTESNYIESVIQTHAESQSIFEGILPLFDLDLTWEPTSIQKATLRGKDFLIVSNSTSLTVLNPHGEILFTKNLAQDIVKIELCDLQNDGTPEWAIFTVNGMEMLNSNGNSLNGYPIKLQEKCYGGSVINYDNAFDHRIFIAVGNTLKCFDEQGKLVQGWIYQGTNAPMMGDLMYRQVQGKDFIVYRTALNEIIALNRKGELRFPTFKTVSANSFRHELLGESSQKLYFQAIKKDYLYRIFISGGIRDSVKIDEGIKYNDISWESSLGEGFIGLENEGELFVINEFGFVENKVLKPEPNVDFLNVVKVEDEVFVFADEKNKKLYLLNTRGEMITNSPLNGQTTCTVISNKFYTCVGSKLIAYELN